jgi:capsular exopolysaccharide synthesis family protein
MDGIQAYREDPGPASTLRHTPPAPPLAVNPAALKTTSNYVQALRRRFWLVLAVAVPLAVATSIMALKLPPIYQARAEIEINPPEIDPHLSTLVAHEIGRRDPSSQSSYVANREARLRSKALAEQVVGDSRIAPRVSQHADPAFELFKTLTVTQVKKNTNLFILTLDGSDPALTKRLLEILLEEFEKQAKRENEDRLGSTEEYAKDDLAELEKSKKDLDARITAELQKTRTLGPAGRSIPEDQLVNLGAMMAQKQMRLGELHQQMMTAQMFPKLEVDGAADGRAARLAQLKQEKSKYERGLERMRKTIRNFNIDPAVIEWAKALDEIMDQIEELNSIRPRQTTSPTEVILEQYREQYRREIEADKEQYDQLLAQMRESMPEDQRIRSLMRQSEEQEKQIAKMRERLKEFAIVRQALVNSNCVRIPASVVEPTVPIKPNRPMLIGLGLCASIGLGVALVCLLERIDLSVKVPEHVTHGLTLPLLGVVPRIRRTALTHRGGHLWTHGTPDSIEADAYRNVRASLLGVADKRGPVVTLLVTSAKAGEGKSTTALNLAATCARAGERTLLLDVDLRRPSLAEVFIEPDPDAQIAGLVDVLRGELPWQRTVRHSELPNLDFIPTGDTRDIPIEILGTLELRQLLIALAHHYDRVILDGPAVLGLADCRVLGRIVDAALLVVRSGSHHLMTLHRAKAMLEQSHVAISGVVFNGLSDDMNNWSSYGYAPPAFAGSRSMAVAAGSQPLALAASER